MEAPTVIVDYRFFGKPRLRTKILSRLWCEWPMHAPLVRGDGTQVCSVVVEKRKRQSGWRSKRQKPQRGNFGAESVFKSIHKHCYKEL